MQRALANLAWIGWVLLHATKPALRKLVCCFTSYSEILIVELIGKVFRLDVCGLTLHERQMASHCWRDWRSALALLAQQQKNWPQLTSHFGFHTQITRVLAPVLYTVDLDVCGLTLPRCHCWRIADWQLLAQQQKNWPQLTSHFGFHTQITRVFTAWWSESYSKKGDAKIILKSISRRHGVSNGTNLI